MATAEELNKLYQQKAPKEEPQGGVSAEDLESTYRQKFGEPEKEEPESLLDVDLEAETRKQEEIAYNLGANLTYGLTRLFGMPGDIDEAAFTEKSFFPTSKELQEYASRAGMTYAPGEAPKDLGSRFIQELGIGGVPVVGAGARGTSLLARGIETGKGLLERGALYTARHPGRVAVAETGAAAGAAGGGEIGEEFFPNNPTLGRALGELTGGIAGGFTASGGIYGLGVDAMRKAAGPFTRAGGRKRAVRRIARGVTDPTAAREKLAETKDIAEEVPVTPAQRTGDPFMARLEKAVREENDLVRERLVQDTAESSKRLKEIAERTGDPEDIRRYLDERMNLAVAKSYKSAAAVRGAPRPETVSTRVRKQIEDAYTEARDWEKKAWNKVPSDLTAKPSTARSAWKEELEELTEGADKKELPDFLLEKLGRLKNGELKGGELGDEPSAKALHQFYSSLGRKLRSEEATKGYNANTVRILKKVRASVLEDLQEVDGGQTYQEAIGLSRDLNRKFTQGPVGEVLGFARAGGPTNTTETMEAIMGYGGEKQRNAVKQLLEASPEAENNVKDFIKSRFVDAAYKPGSNSISATNAQSFIKKYRPILREFPDLREELLQSTKNQKKVDELLGVSDFHDFSPAVRQKRAAGVFLQSDPGEEIQRVISSTKGTPKSVSASFQELVGEVKKDETGRAYRGLKRSFTEYLMAPSGMEDTEGRLLVNGKEMLRRINDLENAATTSKLMDKGEIDRLKKIARVFEGIQKTEGVQAAKEGIIGDKPDMLLNAIARITGARLTQLTPSGGAGVGLQEAQLGSGVVRRLAEQMTVSGATKLLSDAVQDPKVMDDLLKDVEKLGVKEKRKLIDRVLSRMRVPRSAAYPAASTAAQPQEEKTAREGMR